MHTAGAAGSELTQLSPIADCLEKWGLKHLEGALKGAKTLGQLMQLKSQEQLPESVKRMDPTFDITPLWNAIVGEANRIGGTWACLGYVPSASVFRYFGPRTSRRPQRTRVVLVFLLCAAARRCRRCVSSLSACVVSLGEFTCGAFDRKRRRDGSSSICRASRLPPAAAGRRTLSPPSSTHRTELSRCTSGDSMSASRGSVV